MKKKAHPLPHLRRAVQAGFAGFCLFAGWRFYLFYQWAIGIRAAYVPRPAAVEGFLPISALVALKHLLLTGRYDPIHPAGLTIFIAALLMGLWLRKGFCGWICPVGFTSNLAETLGRRAKLALVPPRWLDLPLLAIKYLLLAFFAYLILWQMDRQAIEGFMVSPYNRIVDVKMLYFFLHPSRLAGGIMLGLLVLSLALKNPWCRYLCPYGALLGLLGLLSPLRVRRDQEACISCHRCERACPAAIPITAKTVVRNPECVGCLDCVAACPVDSCLEAACGPRRVSPYLLPALTLALLFALWLTAKATGHWQTQTPLPELRRDYSLGLDLPHPRY